MLMEIRSRKFPRERMREITVKYKIDNTGVIKEKKQVIIRKRNESRCSIRFAVG